MNNSVTNTARLLWAGLRAPARAHRHLRGALPAGHRRGRPGPVLGPGERLGDQGERQGRRLLADRPVLQPAAEEGSGDPDADLKWFQGRPANGLGTNSVNTQYKLILSGAANRSGDNADLIKWVKDAKAAVIKDNSVNGYTVKPSDVPADAVTSSGSGLDPDISPKYADIQVHRIAEKNGLSVAQVQKPVDEHAPTAAPSASSASPASTCSNSTSRSRDSWRRAGCGLHAPRGSQQDGTRQTPTPVAMRPVPTAPALRMFRKGAH